MGRSFHTRHTQHIQEKCNNRGSTCSSQCVLNTGHSYGNINDRMMVVNTAGKGSYLNCLEKYYVQKKKTPAIK